MSDSPRPAKGEPTPRDVAAGRSSQELVFDPRSGRLIIAGQPLPDDVIATDAAASGYFR